MTKISVDVVDSQGNTFNGLFSSQADADKWIAEHKAGWGTDKIPAVAGKDAVAEVKNADGTIKTPAQPAVPPVPETPATYTVKQTDVSAQWEAQAELNVALKAQEFGAQVIAAVYRLNDATGITTNQLLTIMHDPTLQLAERLLWAGSLVSAKQVVQSLSNDLFTADQIAQVSGFIDMKIQELAAYEASL